MTSKVFRNDIGIRTEFNIRFLSDKGKINIINVHFFGYIDVVKVVIDSSKNRILSKKL